MNQAKPSGRHAMLCLAALSCGHTGEGHRRSACGAGGVSLCRLQQQRTTRTAPGGHRYAGGTSRDIGARARTLLGQSSADTSQVNRAT